MPNHKDEKIKVDKSKEMRSMEISNMINEGGLGSEDYYLILKQPDHSEQQATDHTK